MIIIKKFLNLKEKFNLLKNKEKNLQNNKLEFYKGTRNLQDEIAPSFINLNNPK